MSWIGCDEPNDEWSPSNKEEELLAQFEVGEKVHGILNSIGACCNGSEPNDEPYYYFSSLTKHWIAIDHNTNCL